MKQVKGKDGEVELQSPEYAQPGPVPLIRYQNGVGPIFFVAGADIKAGQRVTVDPKTGRLVPG